MIYIVRHGQTEQNSRKLLLGRGDHPLNETGIAQARAAVEKLWGVRFNAVWSSPLIRAVQTARILAPDAGLCIDDRLIEMDCGPYEGARLDALPPEVLHFFSDFIHNPAPPGMEALDGVVRRAGAFLSDRCRTEGNVLISTHAIAMKGMLEYLTPESHGGYWSKYIGNCAIYTTEYLPDGTWSVPMPF